MLSTGLTRLVYCLKCLASSCGEFLRVFLLLYSSSELLGVLPIRTILIVLEILLMSICGKILNRMKEIFLQNTFLI